MLPFLLFDNWLNFFEFHKFVDCLECNFSLIVNCFEVYHNVHVVRRYRTNNGFVVLVVPDLIIFVQTTFVHFVKQSEWSWSVYFLPFFMLLVVFMRLLLAYFDNRACFLLFLLVIGSYVNAIWVMLSRFEIFRFEAGLAEQPLDINYISF